MEIWESAKHVINNAVAVNDRAFRFVPNTDAAEYYDPRLGDSFNWFIKSGRNSRGFENETGRDLDSLMDLIAQKEREKGIPEEQSCLNPYLPRKENEQVRDNPDYIDMSDLRDGYVTPLIKAMEKLDIVFAPVFMTEHSTVSYSTSKVDQWDSSAVGFVWANREFADKNEFMDRLNEVLDNLSDWDNGAIYAIEQAEINPETGEVTGEWEECEICFGMFQAEKIRDELAGEYREECAANSQQQM